MAGLDGIQNRIDPGEPLDKDIYDLPPGRTGKCSFSTGQP
jgi:glutamine synthetase